jgi:hypothetical protein
MYPSALGGQAQLGAQASVEWAEWGWGGEGGGAKGGGLWGRDCNHHQSPPPPHLHTRTLPRFSTHQDVHPAAKGAFTGAVAPGMLSSLGVSYVLAGHSERRVVFGESDADVNAKVRP